MVKITLTNQKSDSLYKTAILNLSEHNCIINNEEKINLNDFKKFDFIHPLLDEIPLQISNNSYRYQFDDLAGLWLAPRRIYGTLIHSKDPANCHFEIFPAVMFYKLKTIYKIPFSLDYHKEAKEKISASQLNSIVSQFSNFQFQFQDKLIIKSQLHYDDLPSEVDGDSLYKKDEKIAKRLDQADDFEKLELRYINHFIGFGVFSRQEIHKGDYILFYYGAKKRKTKTMNYFFHPKLDSFNMGIDAREFGNIARFVNHAPSSEADTPSSFMEANLISISYNVFGIEVIAFFALRDIKKGEQLLLDYSKKYFDKMTLFRFKLNGNLVNSDEEELIDDQEQRVAVLSMFARHGIKRAFFKLMKRYFIIVFAILIVAVILNYSPFI